MLILSFISKNVNALFCYFFAISSSASQFFRLLHNFFGLVFFEADGQEEQLLQLSEQPEQVPFLTR